MIKIAAVILAVLAALMTGVIVGWTIDEQPLPDTFIFWGTTNILASPLVVDEYELGRESGEILSIKVIIYNNDETASHWGTLEVDVISGGALYFGKVTIPSVGPLEREPIEVVLTKPGPAPINGLTNVHFYLEDD